MRKKKPPIHILDLSSSKMNTVDISIYANYDVKVVNISNNNLVEFPLIILSFKFLEALDVSNNQIKEIPKEIFYMKNLKILNFSNNHLSHIPMEIGFLEGIENINLSGNPLIEPYFNIFNSGDHKAMIEFCRDHNVKYSPPYERIWCKVPEYSTCQNKYYETNFDPFEFTVGSLNVLSPFCATKAMFPYAPHYVISWEKRKDTIFKEIMEKKFDIFGLQEVEKTAFIKYFMPKFQEESYESLYYTKNKSNSDKGFGVDGCAMFWKKDKFKMVSQKCIKFSDIINKIAALNKSSQKSPEFEKHYITEAPSQTAMTRLANRENLCLIVVLKTIPATQGDKSELMIVANTHLFWNPEYPDVKLYQACLLMEEIKKVQRTYPEAGTIVFGDFNSTPDSSVYKLFTEGIPSFDFEFLYSLYGNFSDRQEGMKFRDVYGNQNRNNYKRNINGCLEKCCVKVGESENVDEYLKRTDLVKNNNNLSIYTPRFSGTLDYIFTSQDFSVDSYLEKVDFEYTSKVGGFPTTHIPSDHILIGCKLKFDQMRLPDRKINTQNIKTISKLCYNKYNINL